MQIRLKQIIEAIEMANDVCTYYFDAQTGENDVPTEGDAAQTGDDSQGTEGNSYGATGNPTE